VTLSPGANTLTVVGRIHSAAQERHPRGPERELTPAGTVTAFPSSTVIGDRIAHAGQSVANLRADDMCTIGQLEHLWHSHLVLYGTVFQRVSKALANLKVTYKGQRTRVHAPR